MHIFLAILAAILLLPSLLIAAGLGLCAVCDGEFMGSEP